MSTFSTVSHDGMYTVNQLAQLAGVSRRTLHYYDEIGLLHPRKIADNGYRYYDEMSLFELQQILLYREMGFSLQQIANIIDDEAFDLLNALQQHRLALDEEIKRLQTLAQTVDASIMHLSGEITMSEKKVFGGFDEEKQKTYQKKAEKQWGDSVKQSVSLWNSYSKEKQATIMDEGNKIYNSIAQQMALGPEHPKIRALLVRWHQHLQYFYEPTIEMLGGLGDMYHDHPDFNATFTKIDPTLPGFLKQAIAIYVDELEA